MSIGEAPLVAVREVTRHFVVRGRGGRRHGLLRAVDGVSIDIRRGETVGVVGESGSGKTTLGRLVVGLDRPTTGSIEHRDPVVGVDRRAIALAERRRVQMVFQDPYSSLAPTTSIVDSLLEPLRTHFDMSREAERRRVAELLDLVGLPTALLSRRPRELSGGQLQRVAIARALAVEPGVLVFDEPISALDVSAQAQVLNLLKDIQAELGTAFVFISHDIAAVRFLSHRVAVMYLGKVMEAGPTDATLRAPQHPYTEVLLDSVPVPDPAVQRTRTRRRLVGDIPSPIDPPLGCRFQTRCALAIDICRTDEPQLFEEPSMSNVGMSGRLTACHLRHPADAAPQPCASSRVPGS